MAPEKPVRSAPQSATSAAPRDAQASIHALRTLIAELRGDGGCPWDRKQTPTSVAPYLLEEAYELVSAIDTGNSAEVGEELGDVLFQVLFIAQLFEEQGELDLDEVAARTRAKMIRRHPHVFGEETIATAGDVKLRWAEIKAAEKTAQGRTADTLDLPAKLPALLKACRYFDRLPHKSPLQQPLASALAALRELEDTISSDTGSSAPATLDADAAKAAGDALLHLVHTIQRMRQHPETLLNQALQRRFDQE